MAGMEQLEVHSKSYLVRWVNVAPLHTISWSIQPHKKSINFGIFKHPSASGPHPNLPASASATIDTPLSTPTLDIPNAGRARGASTSRNDRTFVFEKLSAIGLKQVLWVGKCDAEKVTVGTYNVPEGEGGMYGLVFDNTFSKTVSKTLTFASMTYPTNAPPKTAHHMHYAHAMAGTSSTNLSTKSSPGMGPAADSSDSLPRDLLGAKAWADRPKSSHTNNTAPLSSSFLNGILHKKRRKRNQGWARRFFSLDYTSCTLSYYRNNHSSALRGAIPLSLAAIGANEKTREISVDSGAEVWHLRASNEKDFHMWKDALDRASRVAALGPTPSPTKVSPTGMSTPHIVNEAEENEWARVERLAGRVAGTRDAVRRLAMDTDPKYNAPNALGISSPVSRLQDTLSPSTSEAEAADYFQDADKSPEKKAFWKRKASSSGGQSPASLMRRSVSAQVGIASPGAIPPVPPLPAGTPNGSISVPKRNGHSAAQQHEEGIHHHCMALLRDLDSVVEDFAALIAESKQRRMPVPGSAISRRSMDSRGSDDEFFDAHDGDTMSSQLLTIRRDSQGSERGREQEEDEDYVSDGASESSSEAGDRRTFDQARFSTDGRPTLYPTRPKSLTPLPLPPVKRRTDVPPCKSQPPNLLAFFRKNVGKDFSTISMPVTTNEPTSALQRLSEQFEYSELLDTAANLATDADAGDRLVHIAAFAVSAFSNMRVKERAIRKPFNPMLGETFELVREDKGFRFIAEKVVHRPVIMACQADSTNWTFVQSPIPIQKFWGKSAELNTDGRARVFLHTTNEHYSWTLATSFLRNVIAGEKYVEPTGTMTIINESTGAKAVCTFKAGGMFAGRSEDVTIQVFDPSGNQLPLGASGKWTQSLELTPSGKQIWKVGALVPQPAQHYGFTTFAASLNQITQIEENHLPVTDSRLRPDQRAHEAGEIDRAEALKARLEERQRGRRRVMEEHGEEWTPRWFVKASAEEAAALGEEEVWRLKGGKDGYWECREEKKWEGVTDVFQV